MLEVGMQQVLGPLISLTIECGRFCRIPLTTKPMLFVLLVYLAFIQLVFLLGPEHFGSFLSLLKLFDFPKQFRYQNELVLVCTAAAYTIAVNVTRRLLDTKQQPRIQPVLQLA